MQDDLRGIVFIEKSQKASDTQSRGLAGIDGGAASFSLVSMNVLGQLYEHVRAYVHSCTFLSYVP